MVVVKQKQKEKRKEEKRSIMFNQNKIAFWIGVLGATITLTAYSQSYVSPNEGITIGLLVLMFGLLRERELKQTRHQNQPPYEELCMALSNDSIKNRRPA
ncbi:hypothetical protein F8388_025581 [Cannabis sativa]|uniref:Uncharacterized protein n=1 Tax=Cannabis sativa TaxID=3483 RepID=A0A7J6G3Q1_CANSA|nr:hypothetical protein F8388_025581 [Cannabis sativa]